jgi:hypothetical protein
MRYSFRTFLPAALIASFAFSTSTFAATAKQVEESLQKGKAALYALQNKNGTWDDLAAPPPKTANAQSPDGGQWTGETALAVYALLAAGENPQDAKLAKAIEFLAKTETTGTYALGIRMQVWLHLPRKPEYLAAAKRDKDILLKSIKTEGNSLGMYDYVLGPGTSYSHSRSQYGVLGIWAADQMGIEIPTKYWEIVERAWISHQAPDGGWTYKHPKETDIATTPGMTAVGIATLFITQDYTRTAEGLACKGNLSNPAIDAGLKWMGDHTDLFATDKKYARDFPYPTLYAVERIGVAAGIKYFKNVDWFHKGADWLIAKQSKTGAWTGGGLGGNIADTSFAMLFLARGRAPILFNKLDYSKGQTGPQSPPWNERPRDVANITHWIGGQVERDLAWQVVPTAAPLADFTDAPILYISGNKPLAFEDADKAKLRAYIEAGGMIVGNADCGNQAFAASFKKLAQELFPAYEFRELPADHPMFTGNFPRAKWKTKPIIYGLSNQIRELMILIPTGDPAKAWQSRVQGGREEFWQMGGAIFGYVSESRDLRYRGDTHLVTPDPKIAATRTLALHRLEHQANWDPEPGGWRRMIGVARNDRRIDLKIDTVKLGATPIPTGGVAHLTGTAKINLSPEQRDALKKFVESGGTLLVDAAGGSSAFASSMDKELPAIFGAPLNILPPEHPLYSFGGAKIPVRFRRAAKKVLAGEMNVPRLQGIEINGRLAVIYSREDLSEGIVGESVEGVIGYEPATATELVAAVLGYVAGPEKTPATKPATNPTTKPAAKPGSASGKKTSSSTATKPSSKTKS